MEEPDDRGASLGVVDDSSVSVSKERVLSSLSDEAACGVCNGGGEDIMVEVLGSDVYIDGVCTDRTVGNLDEVGSTGGEPSVERDGMSPRGDAGVVDGVSGVSESMKETSQEGVEGDASVADAMVLDNNARVDDSLTVSGHVDGETEGVRVEEGNVGSKEDMDVDSRVVSCQDSLVQSIPVDKVLDNEEPHRVEVLSEHSKKSPTENGFGDDSEHKGEGSEHVTEEALITDGGESLEKGPGQKSLEEGEQIVEMSIDNQGTEPGASDVDARNPGMKMSTSSADGSENSISLGTEKALDMCIEKDLNPEVISHSDGAEKDLSNLQRDESCIVEMEHEIVGKSHIDDQNQVDAEGELPNSILTYEKKVSSDEQLSLCAQPKSVEVLEIAARALDSENLNPSITVPENVVNSDSAMAAPDNMASMDSISSSPPNQDAEEAVAAENDGKILVPSIEVSAENEQKLNAQVECRNLESDHQSNGQGGGIGMNVGENAVIDSSLSDFENVEGMEIDPSFNVNQVGLHGEQEMKDVTAIDNDDDQIVERAAENPESSVQLHQARYQLPMEHEGDFSVSDLVWGKVRSHPWWPGQIFDPSDSSDKAMKYYKKDYFLVAYFGDRSFAWNEVSHLKPFRTHFSQEDMRNHSESIQNAIECALEEVSRRSELGLACACTPREAYDMIKCQVTENAGIREESARRCGVDKPASATSFEPAKLIEYIRDLAKFSSDGSDRLELVIAKAQLTAFYRLKGYCGLPQFQFGGLPQFQFCGGLANSELDSLGIEMPSSDYVQHAGPCQDDAQTSPCKEMLEGRSSSYYKRKHNLKDGLYPKRKEKSLYVLMGGDFDNLDGENWSDARMTTALVSPSTKRRKTEHHPTNDSGTPDGRKTASFKIGDCIRRVASQMTGTPPIVKSNSERLQRPDGSFDGHAVHESYVLLQDFDEAQRVRVNFPTEHSSLDELLGQLQLLASDPMMDYSFMNVTVSFFTNFRDSLTLRQQPGIEEAMYRISGKRRVQFTNTVPSPQNFEFEDMSDTYWTDRVIENGTEVQPPRKARKRDYQHAIGEPEKALQGSRRPYKKRQSAGNHAITAEKITCSKDHSSPAELVMNFAEVDSVPSEKTLNNMFRRFGPLRESETEVDRGGGRARVVFKKSSDAEIAYGTAGRFSIFGPRLVNYQLNYTPSTLFKASPIPKLQDQEMHLDLSTTPFQEIQLDMPSFHDHEIQLDLSIHDQDMHLDLSTIEYQEMESVLGTNHDQESKPNYTAHLGEMQADFSTIQYEGQSDLSSMHDQELQTIFVSNQMTQSGLVTTQDQELHHNFTSTQLGEMQGGHTLTHHDEPPASASAQEQHMQPFFAAIKKKSQLAITTPQEESQSVLGTSQEQETHAIHDSAQFGRMQADLIPTHHEKQSVHSTPQEQEMQPVLATTNQDNEMLPILTSAQDHEREPLTTSKELLGEPVPTMTEGQETQDSLDTLKGHEEDVLGIKKQATLSVTISAYEQEDTQPVVLMVEEARGETRLAPTFTEGQETQVLDTAEEHESEHDLGANEQVTQSFTVTDSDTQPLLLTGEEAQEETQPIFASMQELKEMQCDNIASKEQEMQCDNITVQEQEMKDKAMSPEQEMQCDKANSQEQEMKCDNVMSQGPEVQCDDAMTQEQEVQCDNAMSQEQEMQCGGNVTSQDCEMQCDNTVSPEQEMECDNIVSLEQEMECDNNDDKEAVVQPDEFASNEQGVQADREQQLQVDHATIQEQVTESNSTQEQDTKYDVANKDHTQDQATESNSTQEQDIKSDVSKRNSTQDQEADLAAIPDSETHPDPVPTKDQEMQLGLPSSLEKNSD